MSGMSSTGGAGGTHEAATGSVGPLVLVHGGAIPTLDADYTAETAFLRALADELAARLAAGAAAVDVVQQALSAMEGSGWFVAGRGAGPNSEGLYELDASLMDGRSGRAGAVAALRGFKYPSQAALAVLRHEREVFWCGEGARRVAAQHGCEAIEDEAVWFRPRFADVAATQGTGYSTVGAVVRDGSGALAAGTSTGGLLGKRWGRVGDSPVIGAGTWADAAAAVSCTGDGQAFIRAAAAARVALRQACLDEPLAASAAAALGEVARMQGSGALIAIGPQGRPVVAHNSAGVKFAWAGAGLATEAGVVA